MTRLSLNAPIQLCFWKREHWSAPAGLKRSAREGTDEIPALDVCQPFPQKNQAVANDRFVCACSATLWVAGSRKESIQWRHRNRWSRPVVDHQSHFHHPAAPFVISRAYLENSWHKADHLC